MKKYVCFIMGFIIIMMTVLNVNTGVLAVADETSPKTADVVLDVTPEPTMDVSTTVEPTPTPAADYYIPFKINQKKLYPEKTTITGSLEGKSFGVKIIIITVNGFEYKEVLIPKGDDGSFSVEVDFSYDDVGDEVVFTSYSSEEFSFPYQVSFKLESKPLKTPKKTAIKKLKKIGKGKVKVILKKVKNVSGYKVSYSRNKKFKGKGTKTKTSKTNTVVLKGLKAGKYFVKAQTYNACKESKTKYSKATKLKKVKVS